MSVAAFTAAFLATMASVSADEVPGDIGNWTVGDCILVQFSLDIALRPDEANTSDVVKVSLPLWAKADKDQSQCQYEGGNEQHLALFWQNLAHNSTDDHLNRNVTVVFAKRNDTP